MNNAARKRNIYIHRIPDFGYVKRKNDRWRLVKRVMETRRLYKITYKEKCMDEYITLTMYERDLSEQDVRNKLKDENNMDIIEVVEV